MRRGALTRSAHDGYTRADKFILHILVDVVQDVKGYLAINHSSLIFQTIFRQREYNHFSGARRQH